MNHEKLIVDRALSYVKALGGRPNTFALGAASLSDVGAVTSCSTFLGLLLKELFNEAPARFPRARNWMSHLEPVHPNDLAPGHIGVIEYDTDRDGMSGHCFIIGNLRNPAGVLEVIDSCRSSHGTDDTRWDAKLGKGLGGIGRGFMRIEVRMDGAIRAYRWSTLPSSEVMIQGQGQRLVFGRVPRTWTIKESDNG